MLFATDSSDASWAAVALIIANLIAAAFKFWRDERIAARLATKAEELALQAKKQAEEAERQRAQVKQDLGIAVEKANLRQVVAAEKLGKQLETIEENTNGKNDKKLSEVKNEIKAEIQKVTKEVKDVAVASISQAIQMPPPAPKSPVVSDTP